MIFPSSELFKWPHLAVSSSSSVVYWQWLGNQLHQLFILFSQYWMETWFNLQFPLQISLCCIWMETSLLFSRSENVLTLNSDGRRTQTVKWMNLWAENKTCWRIYTPLESYTTRFWTPNNIILSLEWSLCLFHESKSSIHSSLFLLFSLWHPKDPSAHSLHSANNLHSLTLSNCVQR